jgi:hypothetical protein
MRIGALMPATNQRSAAMTNQYDLSRSVVAFEQHNTIIAVAPSDYRRDSGWPRITSSVREMGEDELSEPDESIVSFRLMIRGGGHPKQALVFTPVSRMGPPPRSFAVSGEAIDMRTRSIRRGSGLGTSER